MRRFEFLAYILCTPILPWSISANPIPQANDKGVAIGTDFFSTGWHAAPGSQSPKQFQTTDEICDWLWEDWSATRKSRDNLYRVIRKRSLVWSSAATINTVDHKIIFKCSDSRSKRSIGEPKTVGTFGLICNPFTEDPETWRATTHADNSPLSHRNYRVAGGCKPKNKEAKDQSVEIKAGTTACVDASASSHYSSIEAYLQQGDTSEGGYHDDLIASWISISEPGTPRKVYAESKGSISMVVDHTRTSTYRACAKQRPGQGNARLHLVPIS